jgi:hypothetical protein
MLPWDSAGKDISEEGDVPLTPSQRDKTLRMVHGSSEIVLAGSLGNQSYFT